MLNRYVFIYLFAHLVPAAIGFVALTTYTHLLSPREYGVYVVGMSVAGIVAAVFFAWIRLSVARYQATSTELDLRGTAILAYAGTVTVMASLAPLVFLVGGGALDGSLFAGSLFIALSLSAFEISQEFRRAQLKPLRYAGIAVLRSALGFALGWLAIAMGWGGKGLVVAVAASFLTGAVLNIDHAGGRQFVLFQREHLLQFARYGLPLSLGGLSFALYSVSDRLVVAYLLGQEAAGQFGVAADLSRQFVVILASSVAAATFPITFRTFAGEGAAAARERLTENIEFLLAIVAPVAVWLAVAADPVAKALVGAEFRTSVALLLPMLAVARLLGAVNQFYLQISFQLAEKPVLSLVQETFILVLSIALIWTLVTRFGIAGAAVATLVTEAAGLGVGIMLSRYAFALPFDLQRVAGVLASTAVMGAAIYLVQREPAGSFLLQLIYATGAGGLAYAASAWLFDVARIRTSVLAFARLRTAGSVP
jgi:O-antigen/teichoic acid export membrane protein